MQLSSIEDSNALQVFLVTEFMQGGDLGKRIRSDRGTPRETGWYRRGRYIALGIARGLVYLHSKGIIWFDCKPGNVLLDHTGLVAKIADFGLAKILESTFTLGFQVSSSARDVPGKGVCCYEGYNLCTAGRQCYARVHRASVCDPTKQAKFL